MVSAPFQSWVMVWPLASVQRTVQPLIADEPAVTLTSPWNAPGQELTVRYEAVHPPAGGGGAVVGGGCVVGGAVVGGNGAVLARLKARSGWNDPAGNRQPSASPGGFTQRNP